GLNTGDANVNISGLMEFVRMGGILIYTDRTASTETPLVEAFGINFSGDADTTAFVIGAGPILLNVSGGDKITFTTGKRYAYAIDDAAPELHTIAETIGGLSKICWWEYGAGRVYYIDDVSGTVTGPSDKLQPHINLVGEPLVYGEEPHGYSDLIAIRRMGILSGFMRDVINLNMVIWR
ncbi:MAG: hypothetical protein ABIG39_02435, partial [Candidatus Micrarchaeota archaeon]